MLRKLLPVILLLLMLGGCAEKASSPARDVSASFFAMDTYMSIRAYGADGDTLRDCQHLVDGLEAMLSTTREGSEIASLNRGEAVALSPETRELLAFALELSRETDGALDISVYPVVKAWGFTTGDYRVPGPEELSALLEHVDHRAITLGEGEVTLPEGMEVDLGSVAKGYTGDRLCALLRARGVESAILDLGGNVQALGEKPDGSPWRVGIRDPKKDGLLGIADLRDEAAVTSGGYERYFTDEEGRLWWHIIDPKSGYPARSGLIGVTVVGPSGLRCDALSTALFILGEDGAIDYWRDHRDFQMALVTEDERLLLTPELASRFTPEPGISYTLEVIPDDEDQELDPMDTGGYADPGDPELADADESE